ncbi:hypothetical protein K1720_05190 [Thermococcus argininiproducens]|uniref:Uncharacterized protein n=1 Tax=Thermococcus argininiproducens TaxID=2866384 RepID=A0A9E7M916_9EURY|nr:PCNA-inhibitor [Thermococcus argininiproducens]USG98956.1 hypothetical protein K1720_05190 [Thermococcus argininiproducens]
MNRTLDEFIKGDIKISKENSLNNKPRKKRLKSTKLDQFLPNEHIDYFKALRIGSKRIQRMKIIEISAKKEES